MTCCEIRLKFIADEKWSKITLPGAAFFELAEKYLVDGCLFTVK